MRKFSPILIAHEQGKQSCVSRGLPDTLIALLLCGFDRLAEWLKSGYWVKTQLRFRGPDSINSTGIVGSDG